MLWLKKLDWLSRHVPARLIRQRRHSSSVEPILIRPGGLGDLVVLTRAMNELNIPLNSCKWITEKRNSAWLEHLGVPSQHYHNWETIRSVISGNMGSQRIINTEQHHGLAALFGERLCTSSSTHLGLESNPRADLFDERYPYPQDEYEGDTFKRLLQTLSRGNSPARTPPRTGAKESDFLVVALAGLQSDYKALSSSEWQRLLAFAGTYNLKIRLIGSARDRSFAADLERAMPGSFENLVGAISFKTAVNHVKDAQRFVSVDSGFVHIADYYGTPSDVLFVKDNWKKWGPQTAGSTILALSNLPT